MSDLRMVEGPALPPRWCGYRDGFAALQHLCELGGGTPGVPVVWQRVVTDLAFEERHAEEVLRDLLVSEYVEYRAGERRVALTPLAMKYLSADRGRRRSLRPAG